MLRVVRLRASSGKERNISVIITVIWGHHLHLGEIILFLKRCLFHGHHLVIVLKVHNIGFPLIIGIYAVWRRGLSCCKILKIFIIVDLVIHLSLLWLLLGVLIS